MITNLDNLCKELRYKQIMLDIKPRVVLATGTFDLFHCEHLNYLQEAKKQGDVLVVALKNDKAVGLKGDDRPIIDEKSRIRIVDAIKGVDYSILVDYNPNIKLEIEPENQKQREWLICFQKIFSELRPTVLFYENNPTLQTARDKVCKKYGIEGVMKQRGKGASTTDIIRKIRK